MPVTSGRPSPSWRPASRAPGSPRTHGEQAALGAARQAARQRVEKLREQPAGAGAGVASASLGGGSPRRPAPGVGQQRLERCRGGILKLAPPRQPRQHRKLQR